MNEKEKINKIFSSLENYNFNYNKKIKFFDYSKNTEVKITLNDYLWLFFQSIDNIKIDNITFGTTFWKYIQNITKQKWVKNMEMKELCIDFSGDKILIKGIHDNNFEYFIDREEKYSKKSIHFCESVLHKLFKAKQFPIISTFLSLSIGLEKNHLAVLFISKKDSTLYFYIYDPMGKQGIYYENIKVFLYELENCFYSLETNFIFDITIINKTDHSLQYYSDKKKYGYCVIFSAFFLYCIVMILNSEILNSRNIDFEMLINTTIDNLEKILQEKGPEKYYFLMVSFANIIKDDFLLQIQNKQNIIEIINNKIIYHYYKFPRTEQFFLSRPLIDRKKDEIKQNKTRNYDKELKLLDWNNIKEKRENEECKIDNDCISKKCYKNKCTKPNDNDKLDFLTRLEWKDLNELNRIQTFCKNQTKENFELLNYRSKEFFILGIDYIQRNNKKNKLKIDLKLILEKFKINDYEKKYVSFEKLLEKLGFQV